MLTRHPDCSKTTALSTKHQLTLRLPFRFALILFGLLFLFCLQLDAQRTYTWTGTSNSNWNNTANWSQSPTGGTFPGNLQSNDIVVFTSNGTNAPTVNATPANPIASVTFTGASGNITLTINNNITLTVSGSVTMNTLNINNRTHTLTGAGTLVCNDFNLGTSTSLANARTLFLTYTLANLNINNNLTITTNRLGTQTASTTFTHTSGTITVGGGLVTAFSGSGGTPTATYSMGTSSPRLNLRGATPLTFATGSTNTIDFVGTGATVDFESTSNVTLPATPAGAMTFTNLIIGGGSGNVKTATQAISVTGQLTVEAASTLNMGTFALGTPSSVILETVGGGNGAAITGTTGSFTLGGGVTVNYTGSGAIASPASITKVIALGATRIFTVNDDDDPTITPNLTIGGVISGSGFGITKAGAGTMALTGLNTFTGAVTISAGILEVNTVANANNASSLGTGAGTPTIGVAAAATFRYVGSGHSTTRAVTLSGSGATIDASGTGTLTLGGNITGNTFGLILSGTGDGLLSGVIGTTTGTVTKTGTGSWELSGTNTYSGVTTIAGGTLLVGASVATSTNGPLGNASSAIIMGNTETTNNNWSPSLLIDGAFSFSRAITISNQATSGTYTIGGNTDNNASFSGVITFSQPFTITQVANAGANALTITSSITGGVSGTKIITFDNVGNVVKSTNAIQNGTGLSAVVKSNTGTLTLAVANTHSGGTSLNNGTLNVNNASALGAAAGTFTINGGVLQNTTGGLITTNNHPMVWNENFSLIGSQSLHLGTGAVTMNSDVDITVASGLTLTVGGTINAPTRTLTKAGAGSLNFVSQSISLSGVTIAAGALVGTSNNMNIGGIFTNNATFTPNSGTVTMNSAASSIVNTATLVFNNLIMGVTPTAQSQYNVSFSVAAALTVSGGVVFAPTGGTITMSAATSSIVNSGTLNFNNLTIAATPTIQSQYTASFTVSGSFAVQGGVTFAPTGGTITMSGATGNINIAGTTTFNNLTVSGTTVTTTGNFAVNNTMLVSGVFSPSPTSVISGTGSLTGTGTVVVTRITTNPSFGGQYTITSPTLTDLTVNYNGAGAQTISAANYGNLEISPNGTRTVTLVNGGTIRVSNTFTPTAVNTTYVITGNTFEYNGSGAQTIAAFTYNDLIISNNGGKSVTAGTTVNCRTIAMNDNAVLLLPNSSSLNVQL